MKTPNFIKHIVSLFVILFVGIALYMAYFSLTQTDVLATHAYNKRLDKLASEVVRGRILDATGKVLAYTDNNTRIYPYDELYAHSVGYSTMGKTGVEAIAHTQLLYPDYHLKAVLERAFTNKPFQGKDVVLTLDHDLQKASAKALGNYKGGIVILEPSTGKVKAMYSSPSFDPNSLDENWDSLISDQSSSPLLNRVSQGLYPPGSIFKTVTALSYLETQNDEPFNYYCKGFIEIGNSNVRCYNSTAHGEVDLSKAYAVSCNTYFIALSEKVPFNQLYHTSSKLLFNKPLSFDLPYSKSVFTTSNLTTFDEKASYMGQGKVLVSPLHMALISSAIINDGVLMKPYLIDHLVNGAGKSYQKKLPVLSKNLIDEKHAHILKELMLQVVEEGTARELSNLGLIVGGKTGTAQNETGIDHSWFTGFAYKENQIQEAIAFAILVENGGPSGKALDIAQEVLSVFIEK